MSGAPVEINDDDGDSSSFVDSDDDSPSSKTRSIS